MFICVMEIDKLPDFLIGGGESSNYTYTQEAESQYGYIYKAQHKHIEEVYHFEVFEKKITPVCLNFQEKIYSEEKFRERYPRSINFGSWAYSCPNMERAVEILKTFSDDRRTNKDSN